MFGCTAPFIDSELPFAIVLSEHGCEGTCPAYTLDILSTGEIRFDSVQYVVFGDTIFRVPQSQLRSIIELINASDVLAEGKNPFKGYDAPMYQLQVTQGKSNVIVIDHSQKSRVFQTMQSVRQTLGLDPIWIGSRRTNGVSGAGE